MYTRAGTVYSTYPPTARPHRYRSDRNGQDCGLSIAHSHPSARASPSRRCRQLPHHGSNARIGKADRPGPSRFLVLYEYKWRGRIWRQRWRTLRKRTPQPQARRRHRYRHSWTPDYPPATGQPRSQPNELFHPGRGRPYAGYGILR